MKARGSRAEVMHGTARRTSGGLRKQQLKYNKRGKIVSKRASARAKKENRLVKAGYKTEKGTFVAFKKGKRISRRRSRRKQRGGTKTKKKKKKKKAQSPRSFAFVRTPADQIFREWISLLQKHLDEEAAAVAALGGPKRTPQKPRGADKFKVGNLVKLKRAGGNDLGFVVSVFGAASGTHASGAASGTHATYQIELPGKQNVFVPENDIQEPELGDNMKMRAERGLGEWQHRWDVAAGLVGGITTPPGKDPRYSGAARGNYAATLTKYPMHFPGSSEAEDEEGGGDRTELQRRDADKFKTGDLVKLKSAAPGDHDIGFVVIVLGDVFGRRGDTRKQGAVYLIDFPGKNPEELVPFKEREIEKATYIETYNISKSALNPGWKTRWDFAREVDVPDVSLWGLEDL